MIKRPRPGLERAHHLAFAKLASLRVPSATTTLEGPYALTFAVCRSAITDGVGMDSTFTLGTTVLFVSLHLVGVHGGEGAFSLSVQPLLQRGSVDYVLTT